MGRDTSSGVKSEKLWETRERPRGLDCEMKWEVEVKWSEVNVCGGVKNWQKILGKCENWKV